MCDFETQDQPEGTDIGPRCDIINGYLAGLAIPKMSDFAADMPGNLSKIIEGFQRLTEKLTSRTKRIDSDSHTMQLLKAELKQVETSLQKQEKAFKQLQKSRDSLQNKLSLLIESSRKKEDKLQQERDDLARQVQQVKKQLGAATTEYKKKLGSFLAAQEAIDKMSNKNFQYRNDFSIVRFPQPKKRDDVGDSFEEASTKCEDTQKQLYLEKDERLSAYEKTFNEILLITARLPALKCSTASSLNWKAMPSATLGCYLSSLVAVLEKAVCQLEEFLRGASTKQATQREADSEVLREVSQKYRLLAGSQSTMLDKIIKCTSGDCQPEFSIPKIVEDIQLADESTAKTLITEYHKNGLRYLEHLKLSFSVHEAELKESSRVKDEMLEQMDKAQENYRSILNRLRPRCEVEEATEKKACQRLSTDYMETE